MKYKDNNQEKWVAVRLGVSNYDTRLNDVSIVDSTGGNLDKNILIGALKSQIENDFDWDNAKFVKSSVKNPVDSSGLGHSLPEDMAVLRNISNARNLDQTILDNNINEYHKKFKINEDLKYRSERSVVERLVLGLSLIHI